MKKTGCFRWWVWLGLFVLAILCVVGVSFVFIQARAHAFNARPLVLIHTPINRDRVQVSDEMMVHATARADNGLRRMELWADDQLIAVQLAPADTRVTSLTLSEHWIPTVAGNHAVIVRAVSSDDVAGQATVLVIADGSAASGPGTGTHTVQAGETLDSIAADHGVSLEDLAASNPDLGAGGPVPGDELSLPDDGAPTEEAEIPGDSGEAPVPDEDSPGSSNPFLEMFFLAPLFSVSEADGEPTTLRVEVLELRTWQSFDSLHCYFGLAGETPKWVPDSDDDQTTDESFSPLPLGWWDVESHLGGAAAPVVVWPSNEPLLLNASCVGVTGGMEALDLGHIELSIPSEDWDNTIHPVETDDGEGGHMFMSYRITRVSDVPRGVPVWLDETMTPPTEAILDDRITVLHWEYNPRPDEEPIDGFRIYLNGNLQWVEPPDARQTGLPYEWFHPPCGSTYRFSVTAFRLGFPDGPESMPAVTSIETPLEGCNREVQIIFRSLETFDLGGDGDDPDVTGDVGPAYGYFFANEQQTSFDSRPPEHHGGSLDLPVGLFNNTNYDLNDMSADPVWRFVGTPVLTVDVPLGGTFQFGFHITDQDDGPDDPICEGASMIYTDSPVTQTFDFWNEGTLTSEDGRCRVAYSFGPALGSPVGTGIEGAEPLPWISVEDLQVNETTGSAQVRIRNTGTASWPLKDLDVEVRTRGGDTITTITWPEFRLDTGEQTILGIPVGTLSPPFDMCVSIDPADKVLELFERSEVLFHHPICSPLPDLIIGDLLYDDEHIRVTVENIGDGALDNRTLEVKAFLPDGSPLNLTRSLSNTTLQPGESLVVELTGINDAIRERMRGGYSVAVNPDVRFVESDHTNNSYDVPRAERILVYWQGVQAPRDYEDDSSFYLNAYVVSGGTRRQVAEWSIREEIDWTVCWDSYCDRVFHSDDYNTSWFEIYGDESLEIEASAVQGILILANATGIYTPQDGWGAAPSSRPNCEPLVSGGESGASHTWDLPHASWSWQTTFHICSQE